MPTVTVKVIERVFTEEEKAEIIGRLTDALVEVEGEELRQHTLVTVEEVKSGDWGIGGTPMTTDAIRAVRKGRPVRA